MPCGSGRRPVPASMLSPTSTFCRPHQSPAVLAGSPSGSRRPSRCPFSGPRSQARQPSRHAPAHPPPPPYPLYVSLRHARNALPVHFSRARRSKGRLRVPVGPPFSAALAIRPPCNRSSCRPTAAFPLRMQSRPVSLRLCRTFRRIRHRTLSSAARKHTWFIRPLLRFLSRYKSTLFLKR